LRDSFDYGNKVLATVNAKNALERVEGRYGGPSTRLGMAVTSVWHITDHYGQLVEYLRMNGVVPPATQKYGLKVRWHLRSCARYPRIRARSPIRRGGISSDRRAKGRAWARTVAEETERVGINGPSPISAPQVSARLGRVLSSVAAPRLMSASLPLPLTDTPDFIPF
jgi:hypothetical protein